ncbi:DUF2294 domain-containing protein [Bacillus sp. B15-48]|uniref:DUF2294 domain-containing protein n=1 Tax=Bacillus sp. B15-48 TaxID=1548601 RepID=UPI00193F4FA9|nr:DUF2294 domain-containing protein [Bacillus sp. B15-48]
MTYTVYPQEKGELASENYLHDKKVRNCKLSYEQRRHLQHEFKIYLEKYFKGIIGKGADSTKVIIWNDMVIIRGQGFLTSPEKHIAKTPKGSKLIKESRQLLSKQFAVENVTYFEEQLGSRCIHQTYDIDSNKDLWIHIMIFDQLLIEVNKSIDW